MHWLTQQTHLGIDVSPYKIRLVALRGQRRPSIYSYAEIDVPPGVIEDGLIVQPKPLVELLRELHRHSHGARLQEKRVHVSLPEQQSFMATVSVTGNTLGEVSTEALRQFPYAPNEMYYDLTFDKTSHTAHLAAAKKDIVDSYVGVVEAANYHVIGLHCETEAIANALIIPSIKNQGVLLVDIGKARTSIVICVNGIVHFTTSYPTVMADGSVVTNHLLGALQQTITYYLEHFSQQRPLAMVVLCGSGAYAPQLADSISKAIQLPTALGQPLQKLHLNRLTTKIEQPLVFTTAIGLALNHN